MNKNKIIEFLIDEGALLFGEFITKSKRKSPYFINMGEIKTGDAISKLGRFYADYILELIKRKEIKDGDLTIFGPSYKGIPISIATSEALSKKTKNEISWSFNRKEIKDHGEGGIFVGKMINTKNRVLIVDDVITAGTAIREILPLIKSKTKKIAGLLVLVDRMEKGKSEKGAIEEIKTEEKIKVFSLINVLDIVKYLESKNKKNEALKILNYLKPNS